jgi:plasmid maintenance system killer protein
MTLDAIDVPRDDPQDHLKDVCGSGTHSGCRDTKVGQPFQADVRLESLTYDADDYGPTVRPQPGNRLEKLAGDREGQHSIRINDQWRVCFRREDGEAHDVEIVDYH